MKSRKIQCLFKAAREYNRLPRQCRTFNNCIRFLLLLLILGNHLFSSYFYNVPSDGAVQLSVHRFGGHPWGLLVVGLKSRLIFIYLPSAAVNLLIPFFSSLLCKFYNVIVFNDVQGTITKQARNWRKENWHLNTWAITKPAINTSIQKSGNGGAKNIRLFKRHHLEEQ